MDQLGKFIKVALALALGGLLLLGARSALAAPPAKPPPAPRPVPQAAAKPAPAPQVRTVELAVTERGYEPSPINVKKGEPLKLVITRKTENTCATSIIIDELKVEKELPLNQPVEIAFTPGKSGELKYGCAMGRMVSGVILVE